MLHSYQRIYCADCSNFRDVPTYCGDRFCPICSSPRRARVRHRLDSLIKHSPTPVGYSTKFITLTIPNSENLRLGVKALMEAFRRLRQQRWWKSYVDGGAFVVEITGHKGAWHIHIHAIISARFIPVRLLSKRWEKVSGGKIVWIKRIPTSACVLYLTKYLSKIATEDNEDFEVSDALKGIRLFQPIGAWHNLKLAHVKHPYKCTCCGGTHWMVIDRPRLLISENVTAQPPPASEFKNPNHNAILNPVLEDFPF